MGLYALGIDIGGTKIAAALVGSDGKIVRKHVVATPAIRGGPAILDAAVDVAKRATDEAIADGLTVVAVGVGTAGHVDHDRGAVTYASALLPGWTGMDVGARLQAILALPVSVDNDVNAMAIGEHRFGAGRAFRDVLYLTVGTGVGGALVRVGQLNRGATWTAGEVAHLVIDWDGTRRCACGRPGHLEAYTSGPAIAERYRELAGLDEAPDLRTIGERARGGDLPAAAAIAEGARILGLAVGGLLNVLDAELVVVGGGVAELGDIWWSPLEAALRANPMPGPARVALRRARLGVDAGLIGAGWLALSEHAPDRVR